MITGFIIWGMSEPVYQSDPDAAPDAEFVRGELSLAVPGNRARLLDARRTPLLLTDVIAQRGEIEVLVEAFEHKGVRWRLPLWEIARLQFTPTAPGHRLTGGCAWNAPSSALTAS
ncbi:MAG: hypothetical protein ACRDNS_14675 [Trebonia sp.]